MVTTTLNTQKTPRRIHPLLRGMPRDPHPSEQQSATWNGEECRVQAKESWRWALRCPCCDLQWTIYPLTSFSHRKKEQKQTGGTADWLNFRLPLNAPVLWPLRQASSVTLPSLLLNMLNLWVYDQRHVGGTSEMTKAIHKSSETVFGGFVSLLRKKLKRNEDLDSVSHLLTFC